MYVPQPHLVKLYRGDRNISIDCYGYGKPAPTLLWKRNGVSVAIVPEFNDSYVNDTVQVIRKEHPRHWNVIASLYLRNNRVTYDDAGEFVCEAHNTAAGNTSARQPINIVCKLYKECHFGCRLCASRWFFSLIYHSALRCIPYMYDEV